MKRVISCWSGTGAYLGRLENSSWLQNCLGCRFFLTISCISYFWATPICRFRNELRAWLMLPYFIVLCLSSQADEQSRRGSVKKTTCFSTYRSHKLFVPLQEIFRPTAAGEAFGVGGRRLELRAESKFLWRGARSCFKWVGFLLTRGSYVSSTSPPQGGGDALQHYGNQVSLIFSLNHFGFYIHSSKLYICS